MREHFLFPPNGCQLSRKPIAWTFRIAAAAFPVIPFSATTIFWSWKPVSNLGCANRYVKTKQLSALLDMQALFQDEDSSCALRSPSISKIPLLANIPVVDPLLVSVTTHTSDSPSSTGSSHFSGD